MVNTTLGVSFADFKHVKVVLRDPAIQLRQGGKKLKFGFGPNLEVNLIPRSICCR